MTKQTQGKSPNIPDFAPAGQGDGQAAAEGGTVEHLTLEVVEGLVDKKIKAGSDDQFKRSQSHTDSVVGPLRQSLAGLQKAIPELREAGVEITPEVENKLVQKKLSEALLGTDEEKPGESSGEGTAAIVEDPNSGKPPASGSDEESYSPLQLAAIQVMDQVGKEYRVSAEDAEAGIMLKAKTPFEYLALSLEAAEAKKARMSRLPTGAGTGGAAPGPVTIMDDPNATDDWDNLEDM